MEISRRVKMTKKLIKDAFANLMEKKPINKITVKEICESADVNRSTFYAHYTDQYALFEEIQDDIINITPCINLYEKKPLEGILSKLIEFVGKNKKIYKILFENSTGVIFRNGIINRLFNRSGKDINWIDNEMNLGDKMHFKMLMCAFGGIGLIEKWVLGEFEAKPEDLSRQLALYIEKA
ncbi:MAG: TetR/AcrR family transcriptional regulator C-terminal domain-containing protein [Clostridia bacterium]|nr:TetR/AcrR family transcriptional regulator C-terminal domain-containing protein [Clostridia bacterium]